MWVAIVGAGGFGREAAWVLSKMPDNQMWGFVENDRLLIGGTVNNYGVYGDRDVAIFSDRNPLGLTVGIGDPRKRAEIVEHYSQYQIHWTSIIDPGVSISPYVAIGHGTVICGGVQMTVDIDIGRHVQINMGCCIGHDVRIGDYSTLALGVHVAGNVHIGRGVYIGSGAVIRDGTGNNPVMIADGTVIGAGAVVLNSTVPDCMYVGVPAVPKDRKR